MHLDNVIGQDAVIRALKSFIARVQPRCFVFVGSPGIGKTLTSQMLAADLGCFDEFSGRWQIPCADLSVDAARDVFTRTLRLRFDNRGWNVLILEELEWISKQCQRFLKDALDPCTSMPTNLVVVATSNGVDGLDRALLQRFQRFDFDSGPRFAQACRQEIVRRWRQSAADTPLPHDWTKWGQDEEDFSMRLALRELDDHLCLEAVA